jgi:sugar O-acyltransferase, sialic acid O-acetyltransferase neuD family
MKTKGQNMKEVVIIGASGHGKVVADIILKSSDRLVGFLDDDEKKGREFSGFPILGAVSKWKEYRDKYFIIAIGDPVVREQISKEITTNFYIALHPSAQVSMIDTSIEEGTVVMANAVINSGAKIGKHCIVNTSAVVEHDNQISDFAHISVGAKLAGAVNIGSRTWIGIGATVSNNLIICDNCIIGAGAVVVRDIKESGKYIGVPARKITR